MSIPSYFWMESPKFGILQELMAFHPTQVVFGRSVRTILPTLTEALGTNEFVETARKKINFDSIQKIRYDHHAKNLKDLLPGILIWIQNDVTRKWDEEGVVVEQTRQRTYKVRLESKKMFYRNRKKIRKRDYITSQVLRDVREKETDMENGPSKTRSLRTSERIGQILNT